MSIRLMSKVMDVDREFLNSTEKLVLLVLADKANDEGESAYPSQSTMAEKTSLSDRAVRAVLLRLYPTGKHKLKGLVRVKGKSRYETNDYVINVSLLEWAVKQSEILRQDRNHIPVGAEPHSGQGRNHVPVGAEPRSYNPSGIHQLKHQSARGVRLTQSGLVKREGAAPKAWWEREPAVMVKRLTKKPVPETRIKKIEAAWAACLARGENPAEEFERYHTEFTDRGFDTGWWWVEEWLVQGFIPERGARRQAQPLAAPETFAAVVVR